jgi:hypothetical protein
VPHPHHVQLQEPPPALHRAVSATLLPCHTSLTICWQGAVPYWYNPGGGAPRPACRIALALTLTATRATHRSLAAALRSAAALCSSAKQLCAAVGWKILCVGRYLGGWRTRDFGTTQQYAVHPHMPLHP